jgi:hypothetical protein
MDGRFKGIFVPQIMHYYWCSTSISETKCLVQLDGCHLTGNKTGVSCPNHNMLVTSWASFHYSWYYKNTKAHEYFITKTSLYACGFEGCYCT